MKFKSPFCTIFVMCIIIFSCSTDTKDHTDNNVVVYEPSFQTSKTNWVNFKSSVNNSYQYVSIGDSWTGTTWETTITVKNGLVIQRHFKYTNYENTISEEDREWIETQGEFSSHPFSPAAGALTIDEIYLKAEEEWLIHSNNRPTYFEAKNDGVISFCGFVKEECEDDCFVGIKITSITAF